MTKEVRIYRPKNHIRIVTAASLFDGHDAAINIMRRIIQASGCEVIHLGHNRSVKEIVDCAIEEDVQAIAVTSYQGGHIEYLKYMYDLLKQEGQSHIKIFAGGGGVILPEEIEELENYGIERIYSPDDGRKLGLQGMINDMLKRCDFSLDLNIKFNEKRLKKRDKAYISRLITIAENNQKLFKNDFLRDIKSFSNKSKTPVLGITGTGGSGKSSLIDEIVNRFLLDFKNKTIGIISVDPSKRKTGGALLGDRIRMNSINDNRVYMRSLATRQSNLALSKYVSEALMILKAAEFDFIILETSGIGQSDTEIINYSDFSMYVMTPEYGAATQLEKIDMLDFADIIVLNKFDKPGAMDALRDVKKQYRRNRNIWQDEIGDNDLPVFSTIASQFNDSGVNRVYMSILENLKRFGFKIKSGIKTEPVVSEKIYIIPSSRTRYLSEISDTIRNYNQWVDEQREIAQKMYSIKKTLNLLERIEDDTLDKSKTRENLLKIYKELELEFDPKNKKLIENWNKKRELYKKEFFIYKVRDKEVKVETHTTTLSHLKIPKITLPDYEAWGDVLKWNLQENVPGEFPYTSGVFPFKRKGEDPTRMFAGEGGAERTNKRFHYLSKGLPAKRLSTAFDSVTLYGENPDIRPDIYGKIGNSGVSISTLNDMKKLYSGFDLADSKTSVSMTINGPAPIMTAFFMNAAIDQQCEKYIRDNNLEHLVEKRLKEKYDDKGLKRPIYNGELPETNNGLGLMLLGITGDEVLPSDVYNKIKEDTLSRVRGTVQADILKEDQAQNTCIFSKEFALKMMGDIQEYFIKNRIQNFYSVSISGYHIAEAGANPITQLAFTLANGFTYVEYYLSRGMRIDDFAPNFSFFFSNGMDIEYSVIGRVARRIWAKAMKYKYKANSRSQKLKYHIQTSGRSLHAQEIEFNDIRTTLQALYAIYDNCNSLHTNAYDEAITTPTEESVRRAMAIQLIINRELGLAKNENPLQGSFIIEELTNLVEEAVLMEFDRISQRGGVLSAMESNYQRSKIQDESLYYEHLKFTGEYPLIGVNTFLSSEGSPTTVPGEVIRATKEEKEFQINSLNEFHKVNEKDCKKQLEELKQVVIDNKNIFEKLMEVSKCCSIGQITDTLYKVGGKYRRNM